MNLIGIDMSEVFKWKKQPIELDLINEPNITVLADCFGQLAVHPMVRSEGYCISLAETGFRMSYKFQVFKDESEAMRVAEEMVATEIDWRKFFEKPMPEEVQMTFARIHELAGERGAFRPMLVTYGRFA